jgi:hypothetical protein
VDDSGSGYLRTVCDYVHLNPVRAKLLRAEQPLHTFAWSSYPEYRKAPAGRPAWLCTDRLLGEMGILRDTAAGRQQFELRMEDRRAQEAGSDWQRIRRGWYLGDETFRKELLAQMTEKMGEHHYGGERRENAVEQAERIVRAELARSRRTEDTLGQRPKGDPWKVRLAVRLRRETMMTLKWIAARLQMGSWRHLNGLLYKQRVKLTLKCK